MKWFKQECFTWIDKPKCSKCNTHSNMNLYRETKESPNKDEIGWTMFRVEYFKCYACQNEERFARYDHPLMILKSKTGRCGEWAYAFTCMCMALGHKARLCEAWAEHAWTEVYIDSYKRWVHLDVSEQHFDNPLTYEKDQKK